MVKDMRQEYSKDEINALLDTLTAGEIDDGGIKLDTSSASMRQKDIDFLVKLIQELQDYHEIGSVEECREYKKKALG